MKSSRFLLAIFAAAISFPLFANEPSSRPKIFSINSVTFFSSNIPAARAFFAQTADVMLDCKSSKSALSEPFVAALPSGQTIQVTRPTGDLPAKLLANVSFRTDNVSQMANFLKSKNVQFTLYKDRNILSLVDPEGNRISFVGKLALRSFKPEELTLPDQARLRDQVRCAQEHGPGIRDTRLIHAGFIVHYRETMEHFYEDIFGFRPYWHGGMKDDQTDWVSMQVPDGTDWIEFMLNVPDNADKHLLGIMNHIALGVTDIHATQEQLRKNGAPLTEEPKLGRDGKWQLNLYDPDQTRIEFMEFTPKGKTCCSEFTAPHPKP